MHSQHFHKGTSVILPSNPPISLIGGTWRCLESDSWEEKHAVFFGDSADFCILTMCKDSRLKNRSLLRKSGDWVIETNDQGMMARARLQILGGDYKQGILLLDYRRKWAKDTDDIRMIIAQLITSCFITQRLDTLKILPATTVTSEMICTPLHEFESKILTFTAGECPLPKIASQFHLERERWLASEQGMTASDQLGWLQKRIQREAKSRQFSRRERKMPWFLRLLSLGRRRGRRDDMIHPLDEFRKSL